MTDAVLSVKGLVKKYETFTLGPVSFAVRRGTITGLIGRNGAGKSTALKSITGLVPADGGEIMYLGMSFKDCECEIKSRMGFVGGGFGYYPLVPLKRIAAATAPFYPEWNDAAYRDYMVTFGLDENKRVKELSDGMKVKFALTLALSHGAEVLVLDEPTSGLDPLSREELCDIILGLTREKGISVLFSTHITSDLIRMADDLIYLSEGRILAAGALTEIISAYKKAVFPSETAARACGVPVIGLKNVKNGCECLICADAGAPKGAAVSEADIDSIMIHIEKERENDNA